MSRFEEKPDQAVDWFPDSASCQRVEEGESLQLEQRGVTSQKHGNHRQAKKIDKEATFWRSQTIHKNTVAAKLRSIGRREEAKILENCHSTFTIAHCGECGRTASFPNRCDLFFCPECARRLQKERAEQVLWWVNEVHQPKHVVLTSKNTPTITKSGVQQFRSWWNRLRRSKFARNWKGGFYRFEVTNEGKGWHLHLHALVDARWIDERELAAKWQSITCDAGRIVRVKDCRGSDYLHEVTKYCVKGNQLAAWQPEQIATFIDAFKTVRTFGVFGSLYGKRTEFAEWIAELKGTKPRCECGSCNVSYYSETEWLMHQTFNSPTERPRPPDEPTQPTLRIRDEPVWPD